MSSRYATLIGFEEKNQEAICERMLANLLEINKDPISNLPRSDNTYLFICHPISLTNIEVTGQFHPGISLVAFKRTCNRQVRTISSSGL